MINSQPTPFAHFATYPEAIPDKCIRAGTSARGACPHCGAPWRRVVERGEPVARPDNPNPVLPYSAASGHTNGQGATTLHKERAIHTVGWEPTCDCEMPAPDGSRVLCMPDPVPCTVLDPFHGSGTTGLVAVRLGRAYVGVDISQEYLTDITDQRVGDGVQIGMGL